MLNIRDLKIDNASLGDKLLLVEVVPAYEYKDKQRTDNITGYRYVVCKLLLRVLSKTQNFGNVFFPCRPIKRLEYRVSTKHNQTAYYSQHNGKRHTAENCAKTHTHSDTEN